MAYNFLGGNQLPDPVTVARSASAPAGAGRLPHRVVEAVRGGRASPTRTDEVERQSGRVYVHLGARRDEPPRRQPARAMAEVDPDQEASPAPTPSRLRLRRDPADRRPRPGPGPRRRAPRGGRAGTTCRPIASVRRRRAAAVHDPLALVRIRPQQLVGGRPAGMFGRGVPLQVPGPRNHWPRPSIGHPHCSQGWPGSWKPSRVSSRAWRTSRHGMQISTVNGPEPGVPVAHGQRAGTGVDQADDGLVLRPLLGGQASQQLDLVVLVKWPVGQEGDAPVQMAGRRPVRIRSPMLSWS
jgi:hypothetical protein